MNKLIGRVTQEIEHRLVVAKTFNHSESTPKELENERISITIDEHGITGHTSHGVSERYYETDHGTLITEREDHLNDFSEKWEFDRNGFLLKYEMKMSNGAAQILVYDKDNPLAKQAFAFPPVKK